MTDINKVEEYYQRSGFWPESSLERCRKLPKETQ